MYDKCEYMSVLTSKCSLSTILSKAIRDDLSTASHIPAPSTTVPSNCEPIKVSDIRHEANAYGMYALLEKLQYLQR